MAYARLGTVYSNLGQLGTAEEYRTKAFELKDRAKLWSFMRSLARSVRESRSRAWRPFP
jgi:hypothetical protein